MVLLTIVLVFESFPAMGPEASFVLELIPVRSP